MIDVNDILSISDSNWIVSVEHDMVAVLHWFLCNISDTSDDSGLESDDSGFHASLNNSAPMFTPEPIRGANIMLLNSVSETNGHIDSAFNGDSSVYKTHNKLIVKKANQEVKKPGKSKLAIRTHLSHHYNNNNS